MTVTEPLEITPTPATGAPEEKPRTRLWLFDILLVFVLLAGAYFRFIGLNWDEFTWMHPDERFLVWVTSDIAPVESIGQYFDTANSSLNPNNRGHGFFVYGTFPIFLTRYLVSAIYEVAGWQEIAQVGRPLSAALDLLTVLLVYLIAARVYDRKVALLAAAFLAAAVLPIQLSRFYKEDTFANFFTLLAIYFAVRVATVNRGARRNLDSDGGEAHGIWFDLKREWPLYVSFGIALGLAVASKLNTAPVAFLLPVAVWVRFARLPQSVFTRQAWQAVLLLAIAGATSLLIFRIFQPYAFQGPGFFGVLPNQQWISNIREQRNQAAGDVDFPPAMQWARRPPWFAWENLTVWGLGLPLGLLAWAGFLWVGWRMLKGEWRTHLLLWGWTAAYFLWQATQFNPTMRYFLPVYPTLAMYAGWVIVRLWESRQAQAERLTAARQSLARVGIAIATLLVGGLVLLYTYGYAYAFAQVATQPMTRVAASRWIYENIPGPLNIRYETSQGDVSQTLSYPYDYLLRTDLPYSTSFLAEQDGSITALYFPHIYDQHYHSGEKTLNIQVTSEGILATGNARLTPIQGDTAQPFELVFLMDRLVPFIAGQVYQFELFFDVRQGQIELSGELSVELEHQAEIIPYPLQLGLATVDEHPRLVAEFTPDEDGLLAALTLAGEIQPQNAPLARVLAASLSETPDGNSPLASGSIRSDFWTGEGAYTLHFDQSVPVEQGRIYYLLLTLAGEPDAAVSIQGSAVANEGDWDDGLPLRLDGKDGFGGIYQRGLNFNMYWDDNPDKLARFERILNEAEYLFISSNRQWASLPRLPERFPLVTRYYRELLGCPAGQDLLFCYGVVEPGMFAGNLGFELVQVFQSNPQLGPLEWNTQFAEEAFTVYDHPKVLIFKKADHYDPQQVSALLGEVDLTRVIRVTPKRAASHPMDLMLPETRLATQQEGGTWSELFNPDGLFNRVQPLGVLVWYGFITLLGWAVYPLMRMALPGLADRGYPLARLVGMLLLAYLAWLAGSLHLPYDRPLIALIFLLILLAGLGAAYLQRAELSQEWRTKRANFLTVEVLALVFFLAVLGMRWANPDLWHPWKGGEKPMDFAYFNAVLRSTSFPPYDPWFAGGYINYYYYGFVLVGTPVKLLGIVPSIAYNLIIPTLFSLIGLGAYCLGWNLVGRHKGEENETGPVAGRFTLVTWVNEFFENRRYLVGLGAAFGVAVLGNLGSLRMILRGYQMLAATVPIDEANLFSRTLWTFQGFIKALSDASLPYGVADWYWLPSRAIPALGDVEPITEFPFFTVTYADLHAHLIALPVTILVLAWSLSVLNARGRWSGVWQGAAGFLLGGLAIGALRPTNTWDFPTYLVIGALVIFYSQWRYFRPPRTGWLARQDPKLLKWLFPFAGILLLVGLSFVLYQPYAYWYGQGYTAVDEWTSSRTPLGSYFIHWGVFLFLIVSWMVSETIDWMAATPLSALKKLVPYKEVIYGLLFLLAFLTLALAVKLPDSLDVPLFGNGVQVAWAVLPLGAWTVILLLRPGLSDARRAILFLVGSGLFLTLVVELIVLRGDIGRMNTVFKFYYQVWILFGISAAASLGWLMGRLPGWNRSFRLFWQAALAFLVISAALYPLLGATAKMKDRMTLDAPRTLDGLAFVPYSEYADQGVMLTLDEDYAAIRWLQENVAGSPVIVEAHNPEYRWGSRISIYTGLPAVIGWNWHQRQQRGAVLNADWVNPRIQEVSHFYTNPDSHAAYQFLLKYDVRYFIVGQLEAAYYPGPGLEKFDQQDGLLWRAVFQDGATTIYEVLDRSQAILPESP
jgi:YYY domain-containing protein